MAKSIICTTILTAFMLGLQQALLHLADTVEFSSFALTCGALMALTVAAAFAYDWHEGRPRY
jgi:hypothetical protein